jgi:2-polyprenyl-3-methyl-5-hydroxy-6-metoxy-1,4-benzoquinol methylase
LAWGGGAWALMVKGFGCNSYGCELSDDKINYAQSNGINTLTWDEIPRYNFDFINTEQVFEHLANPLETLTYLKSSLKVNGIIKISVPTANNIKRRLSLMDWSASKGTKNSLNPVAPLEHINCYSRTSLVRMANIAGLEEIKLRLKTQYKYLSCAGGINKILTNLFQPIKRNILQKENHLFFQKKPDRCKLSQF